MDRRTFLTSALVAALWPGLASADAKPRRRRLSAQNIPNGYVATAHEQGIPPVVLFAVALQESQMLFGARGDRRSLPWPWTLNVAGVPYRYPDRQQAQRCLDGFLGDGITSIDIGLMQVNWRHHRRRLVSTMDALEPYNNLRVGASLLREHFVESGSWFDAIGRYHSKTPTLANQYAHSVFRHIRRLLDA